MTKKILLSQFATKRTIRLGIKGSKNVNKKVRVGATVYESKFLSIIINPRIKEELFTLKVSKSGGLVLEQDPKGDLKFVFTSDITAQCISKPSGENAKYIEVCYKDGSKYLSLE